METAKLKKFAQFARRSLLEQVSAKLKLVLAENSAARRENPSAVASIEKAVFGVSGKHSAPCPLPPEPCPLAERVAYIWFNRFCALRFMDVNRYTRIGVVSPAEGQVQPEILAEAKMGHIDEEMVPEKSRQQIFALLDGKAPSHDPQSEAYHLLLVAACNFFHRAMPFLFQRIDDYTELLMPDDLLSGNSILTCTREAMTPDVCGVGSEKWKVGSEDAAQGGVEVIGWLYQFYISEKKDEVFEGLKKNRKITPENIPAATQLFTPHWIVKYLVENSLGRLWMLNRPNSRLVERMEYYIRPETSVGSGKWGVGSGEWEVGSGEWEVESKEKHDGSAKLSGTNRLAEGNGLGGVGVSGNQDLSQGGTLRTNQSDSQGSSVDSLEHSRGASASIDSGIQKFSIHSARIESGSGNANHDSAAAGVSSTTANRSDSQSNRGNQADDLFINSEAEITSHSPLPTSHLSFVPDEDNVIPILDGDWFTDDITERFRKFLRVTFGDEHYEDNLQFVEKALGKSGKARDIRDYFLKDFYSDHVKRYKKRPIYWLFSSPKGSFNALIYMHRYRPDTVSVVLNDYLREFRAKLTSHKSHLEAVSISAGASQGEKTKALKEIEKLSRMITELEEYEREVLYPLATEQVEIDLDDGVKVNYPKFGAALKKIVGLEAKED